MRCPWCESSKPDLCVWEEGGIYKYYCYGGICGVRGAVMPGGTEIPYSPQKESSSLPEEEYQDDYTTSLDIQSKYHFTPLDGCVSMDIRRRFLDFPFFQNGSSIPIGRVRKNLYTTWGKNKNIDLPADPVYNTISKVTGRYHSYASLVVFEDILSALKFNSMYGNFSCATLSCTIPSAKFVLLSKQTSRLILALDADALGKAIIYKHKYSCLFDGGIEIMPLGVDFKDAGDRDSDLFIKRVDSLIRG